MSRSLKHTYFTFIWKIENFSRFVMGPDHFLRSPPFNIFNKKWELNLLTRDDKDFIEVEIKQSSGRSVFIACELSFVILDDGDEFTQRGVLFGLKKDLLLPQDTLTVYCRISRFTDEPPVWCIARTDFARKTLEWKIEEFSKARETHTQFETDSLHFDLDLHKIDSDRKSIVTYNPEYGYTHELFIKQINGDELLSGNYSFCIIDKDEKILFYSRSVMYPKPLETHPWWHLLKVRKEWIFDDALTIKFEFTLQVNTISFEDPTKSFHGKAPCPSSIPCGYLEWIPGVEEKVLGKVMPYLYTDTAGRIELEWASKLHKLADKFDIKSLKDKCLSISKACQALVLADERADENLMRSVMDYVCEHDEVIFLDEWRDLEDENPGLTTRVLREMYLRKAGHAVCSSSSVD